MWFFLALAVIVVAAVVLMLRSGKLREKYAALWVIVGLAVIVLAVFPSLLEWVARLVGVQVPSNLLFAMALLFLLAVTLHLSLEISRSEEQIRILAEHVAMLNHQQEQASPRVRNEPVEGAAESRSDHEGGSPGCARRSGEPGNRA